MNEEREDDVEKLIRLAGRRPQMDPERMARVREAVHGEWRTTVKRRRVYAGAVAVSVAAAAVLVLLFLQKPEPPRILQTPATYDWQGATLRIEPGTRVLLFDDMATLEQGTLYYSSGTRKDQITIRTSLGDVQDIGTKFEVRLDQDGVHVRVDEGLVKMRDQTAGAGMRLFADAVHAELLIALEGQTLRSVVEQVARAKGLSVQWKTAARDAKLHGDVPLSLGDALDAATAAAGVSYRIEEKTLVVTP